MNTNVLWSVPCNNGSNDWIDKKSQRFQATLEVGGRHGTDSQLKPREAVCNVTTAQELYIPLIASPVQGLRPQS